MKLYKDFVQYGQGREQIGEFDCDGVELLLDPKTKTIAAVTFLKGGVTLLKWSNDEVLVNSDSLHSRVTTLGGLSVVQKEQEG